MRPERYLIALGRRAEPFSLLLSRSLWPTSQSELSVLIPLTLSVRLVKRDWQSKCQSAAGRHDSAIACKIRCGRVQSDVSAGLDLFRGRRGGFMERNGLCEIPHSGGAIGTPTVTRPRFSVLRAAVVEASQRSRASGPATSASAWSFRPTSADAVWSGPFVAAGVRFVAVESGYGHAYEA